MKSIKTLLPLLLLVLVTNSYAQKIKVASGDLSSLVDVSEVNVVYDFSDFEVGKMPNEQAYLDKRSAEMNEKEAGTGEAWMKRWHSAKEDQYPRRFEELFVKYAKKIKIVENETDVKMVVKTTFIEPGYNVGISRRPSLVNYLITFKKGEEELASFTVTGSPGNAAMGYDFDAMLRIQESFAKAAKEFGYFLTKKVK